MLKTLKLASIGFTAGLMLLATPLQASAATMANSNTAKVSFTFDDGYVSSLTKAAPTLAKYGFSGTNFITTSCVGTSGTCPADPDAAYMSWSQIATLQNTYRWEIGAHSVTHPLMSTLSDEQIRQEVVGSKQDLQQHGFNPTAFATPYGDYDNRVLAEIARNFSSHRGFHDVGYNPWPYSDYIIRVQQVQKGVSVNKVKNYIAKAKQNRTWLVLVFHDIKDSPSPDPEDYEYGTNQLDQIAKYVKNQGVAVTNPTEGLASGTNMLPNATFNNGIADGWSTDGPGRIVADSGNNGSHPDALNSIRLTSGEVNSHLFAPKVAVNSSQNYVLKNFLNVRQINSGAVGFYIDEYDVSGNWISGQYRVEERSVFVERLNFIYKPTSANVKQASLQVIVPANSGILAYLDNVEWFVTN